MNIFTKGGLTLNDLLDRKHCDAKADLLPPPFSMGEGGKMCAAGENIKELSNLSPSPPPEPVFHIYIEITHN
jgi:hypothetical protein